MSDYEEVKRKGRDYLGESVEIFKSDKPSKKYYIINPTTNKKVYFGQAGAEDFTYHKDPERRRRYLARATAIRGNWRDDPYSPNNLSIKILW